MKVLFVGPYRQNDGWGVASRKYLECFLDGEHDIQAQPVKLGHSINQDFNSEKILEAEENQIDPDIIIHYMPPVFVKPVEGKKNVCFFHYETQHPCPEYMLALEKVDHIFVSTENEFLGLLPTDKKVSVIQFPVESKDYEGIERTREDDAYVFYFIGEMNTRKNIHGLLLAYLTEFSKKDNVKLIIKSNVARQDFHTYYMHIEQTLRKREGYPEVIYIEGHLSDEDLLSLHKNSDCFVSLSLGESICLPLIDALMIGNKAIVTGNTGMGDLSWAFPKHLYQIPSGWTPCFCPRPPMPFIYTSEESWGNPMISSAMTRMRDLFEAKTGPPQEIFSNKRLTLKEFDRIINEIGNIV